MKKRRHAPTPGQIQSFIERLHRIVKADREKKEKELNAMGQKLCGHIKQNGAICEAVALRESDYCYFHHRTRERERNRTRERERNRVQLGGPAQPNGNTGIEIPLLEDNNSIQIALQQTIEALIDRRIDHRRAALILYALQTAIGNLRHTRFKPRDSDRTVTSL